MPTSRTASLTRNSSALKRAALVLLAAGGCFSPEQGQRSDSDTIRQVASKTRASPSGAFADSLSQLCPLSGQRGSLQVARVDPKVEEGGVAFELLGGKTNSGVVLCHDALYADASALTKLMGDSVSVSENEGFAIVDHASTTIPAYNHAGVLYVAVAPFALNRRALLLPSPGRRMDATVWPRQALLHLKRSGLTQGRAYQTAVREGLLP